jgi:hypothetical protein
MLVAAAARLEKAAMRNGAAVTTIMMVLIQVGRGKGRRECQSFSRLSIQIKERRNRGNCLPSEGLGPRVGKDEK